MMRSSDDTRTIQTALNQLPTIYPDTVTVSKATAGTSATLTVTFNSQRGNLCITFPLFVSDWIDQSIFDLLYSYLYLEISFGCLRKIESLFKNVHKR